MNRRLLLHLFVAFGALFAVKIFVMLFKKNSWGPLSTHRLLKFSNSDVAGDPMSFWGAHEFRHNPKNRPPKKIPHKDCTAGIKVPPPLFKGRVLKDTNLFYSLPKAICIL